VEVKRKLNNEKPAQGYSHYPFMVAKIAVLGITVAAGMINESS
jgi:hypothetical protein